MGSEKIKGAENMKKYLISFALIITYLLYLSNFGAMGAVMDTRLMVVIFSLLIFCVLVVMVFKVRKLYLIVLLFFSLIISGLSLKELFFTYDEEEIAFQSAENDFFGTLYTPKYSNANCLVVFLHGSGNENRKEYAFHARHLARQGIAGFAYDKRGSGKSGGDTYEVGYHGYAKDAVAAISRTKELGSFDQVGLFAVSEGEWVSLIVDSMVSIDFIVMISASGTSPLQQTIREMTYRLERKGFDADEIQQATALYSEILKFDNDSVQRIQIEEKIRLSKEKPWFEAAEDFQEVLFFYPWWNRVMDFTPSSYLYQTSTDILVLFGKENQSYPAMETMNNFKVFRNVRVVAFEKGDHSLLDWKFGEGIPPPFFVKGYLKTYSNWILDQCN